MIIYTMKIYFVYIEETIDELQFKNYFLNRNEVHDMREGKISLR